MHVLACRATYMSHMYAVHVQHVTTGKSPTTAGTATPLSYCQKVLLTAEHNRYAKLFRMNSKGIPTLLNAD